ncbi:MAG: hypothetical protein OQJ77_03795, partial [Thiovulaceae bacterium]|nr:hypothetical protein [Sulfurimonadaceae bacterium]
HPALAHFAISLPILSLVLGAAYLYKPSEVMSKVSSRFFVFAALFIIAAFFSGKHDGSEVYALLSSDGKKLLIQHKDFGLYIAIAMGIAALVKFFGCIKKNFKVEIVSVILVAIVAGGVLYQGKMGGELTYTYGAHVKGYSDGMDCLEEMAEMEDDE